MLLATLSFLTTAPVAAQQPAAPKAVAPQGAGHDSGVAPDCAPAVLGSPYIPVDSWVYPAMLRLYSLGYVDDVFLGMRPWTRASLGRMVEQAGEQIADADEGTDTNEAQSIYDALVRELRYDSQGSCLPAPGPRPHGVGLLGGAWHQRHPAARQAITSARPSSTTTAAPTKAA